MNADILEQKKEIISVGELNNAAKRLLETNFNDVSVIGEISNLSRPSSGHIYFSLKDDEGAIRCAMFRNANSRLKFVPKNGDKCILNGQVSIYAARGDYQLIARSMRLAGAGDLMQQFESLKEKLDAEGMFDTTLKQSIPKFPKHICVITSSSTAAYQDVLSSIKRRSPFVKITISEAVVQGDDAPQTIIHAIDRIEKFNKKGVNEIDVVIITRGGGSIEDLWCFNNELLARKIYSFKVPVISGVGHEIDFTITDFVSDMRAPTPTAAAEIVTESYHRMNELINIYKDNLIRAFKVLINDKSKKVLIVKSLLKSPSSLLREKIQKIDNIEINLRKSIFSHFANGKQKISYQKRILTQNNPIKIIRNLTAKIDSLNNSNKENMRKLLSDKNKDIKNINENLNILNPLAILSRGYSIIKNKKGNVIKSSSDIELNEDLLARFNSGTVEIKVNKINE